MFIYFCRYSSIYDSEDVDLDSIEDEAKDIMMDIVKTLIEKNGYIQIRLVSGKIVELLMKNSEKIV